MTLKKFHSNLGHVMEWTPSMPDLEVFIDVDGKLYEIGSIGGGGSTHRVSLYARTELRSAQWAHLEGRASAEELEAHNQSHRRAVAAIAALNLPKTDAETNTLQQDHPPTQKPHCDLPSENARKRETPEIEHH
jgi:hypothetical protein